MRTKRIHDIGTLKDAIKEKATEGRDLRNQARATSGLDRHALKEEARTLGSQDTRFLLLAYGYLRGRRIEQMESSSSHPKRLVEAVSICDAARPYFQKGPEAEAWQEEVRGETRTVTQVPDNRGFFAKLVGTPAPEPQVRVQKWVDYNDPPGWDEFVAMIEADIAAWDSKCCLSHATKMARRRQRKAEKDTASAPAIEVA